MKKRVCLFLFSIFLFSCNTVNDNVIHNLSKESNNKEIFYNNKNTQEKDFKIELIKFNFDIEQKKNFNSINEIYKIKYVIIIVLRSNNHNFNISYSIYDEEMNPLLEKKMVEPKRKDSFFIIYDSFFDYFCYRQIYYNIEIEKNGKIKSFKNQVINEKMPFIKNFEIGHILTFIEEKTNAIKTNLSLNISIENTKEVKWIKVIPPDEKSFWDIPFKHENNSISAIGNLNYKKHPSYIENGNYILQINLGEFGIIQKSIKIVDIFNNQKGANYGLPIVSELKSNKDLIILNLTLIDKIEKIEFVLFEKNNNEFTKLGKKEFYKIDNTILKKDLIFKNEDDEFIKIKYNYKYYYKIILYSKKINNLEYISISKFIPIVFSGFFLNKD